MKALRSLLCVICLCAPATAQVTGNVLSRVFQIRFAGFSGSAFVIDIEQAQYFVTAEHMVKTAAGTATIELLGNKGVWLPIEMRILHGNYPCSDVAVLIPKIEPTKFLEAGDIPEYPNARWTIGQEAYFLGFPYGLYTKAGGDMEDHAVPMAKHGYISALVSCDAVYPGGAADKKIILLDGINNHGFSGGPVVAPDIEQPNRALKLIGVISGYKNDPLPLNVNGQEATNAGIAGNSGIIFVMPFDDVLELIKKDKANPIAPSMPK